jgi:hypothetical protein
MANIPSDPIEYKKVVNRIKNKVDRWPSAYASGMVVREYKKIMNEKGKTPYTTKTSVPKKEKGLKRWFDEKWIDIKTNKPCGAVHNSKYYPTCRPKIKITNQTPTVSSELSKKEKESMIKQKQKAKKKTVNYKETKK